MSTETADIERIARDIYAEASPLSEFDLAPETRRKYCMNMARYLYRLGYKHSIVHDCCITAQDSKPRVLTAKDDLASFPPGSVITAHWEDGSQPDLVIMHSYAEDETDATAYAVLHGRYWENMANWGATLTLQHTGTA